MKQSPADGNPIEVMTDVLTELTQLPGGFATFRFSGKKESAVVQINGHGLDQCQIEWPFENDIWDCLASCGIMLPEKILVHAEYSNEGQLFFDAMPMPAAAWATFLDAYFRFGFNETDEYQVQGWTEK